MFIHLLQLFPVGGEVLSIRRGHQFIRFLCFFSHCWGLFLLIFLHHPLFSFLFCCVALLCRIGWLRWVGGAVLVFYLSFRHYNHSGITSLSLKTPLMSSATLERSVGTAKHLTRRKATHFYQEIFLGQIKYVWSINLDNNFVNFFRYLRKNCQQRLVAWTMLECVFPLCASVKCLRMEHQPVRFISGFKRYRRTM